MKRQKSREIAMELLFGMELSKNSMEESIEMFIENEENDLKSIDMDYVKRVISLVNGNIEKIDEIIEKSIENWKKDRISKVNLIILRLSIGEMLYMDDVPGRVAINEGIELAKRYSDEKSKAFINGALDKALKIIEG